MTYTKEEEDLLKKAALMTQEAETIWQISYYERPLTKDEIKHRIKLLTESYKILKKVTKAYGKRFDKEMKQYEKDNPS